MKLSCVSPASVMRVLTGVVIGVLVAASASAQVGSGISGVVKDVSGAVLPGVTVEVGEPRAHRGRAIDRDRQLTAQYQIIDLRPGDYTVTFTLAGFKTVRREGIRLAVAFTATVNGELQVGQLEESITVTGASPLVDVRNSVSQSVMSRETLDTIPTGKDPFAVGQLIRRRHHQHARRRRHADHAAADAAGARLVEQRQRVHGRQRPDPAHRLRRQPDRVLLQRRADGGDQLPDQLAAGGSAGRRRADQHDPARRRQPVSTGRSSPPAATQRCRATTWTTSCVALGFHRRRTA